MSRLWSRILGMLWRLSVVAVALASVSAVADRPETVVGRKSDRSAIGHRKPMTLRRDGDGSIGRGRENEYQSTNWSGYVLNGYATGKQFRSVSGAWQVPKVVPQSASRTVSITVTASATWVGIGGSCKDTCCQTADTSLIQVGTEQDAYPDGSTDYYAWYELLPADSQSIPYAVSPGDYMTASIICLSACTSSDQLWSIEISDSTAGWVWTRTQTYASTEISAEWIEEAPSSSDDKLLPLANFSAVTFLSASANGANPNLSLVDEGIELYDSQGFGGAAKPSAAQNGDRFSVCRTTLYGLDDASCSYSGQNSPLVAAILPASRSMQVGTAGTVFATMINTGSTAGQSCAIAPTVPLPVTFQYQAADPSTNAPIGSPNQPVAIAAGGSQSFVLSFDATQAFDPSEMMLGFTCAAMQPASPLHDVNTVVLSASTTPTPDIIALVATPSADGILDIPNAAGSNAFAIATSNVGASGAIAVSASTGSATLPVSLDLCQTVPATGQCLSPPSASVTTTIGRGATPTFAVFATAQGPISLDPAANRIFVQFSDQAGVVRGLTSVALVTR